MDPNLELLNLTAVWYNAVGAARDTAFNNLVTWMANNPQLAQNMVRNGGVLLAAYETHLLRVFAAGATVRIAQRRALPTLTVHMARLSANFIRTPKAPHPIAMGLIFIGAIALTGCEVKTENDERQAAIPSYNLYVTKYIAKMVVAKQYHPWATMNSPMTFEEWYQADRT